MTESTPSSYRFVIVFIVAVASFLGNFVIFQMAGLAPQIIGAIGLSGAKFGLIIGISILTAAILGMPLGALGDRIGVKPVVAVAMAVTLVGAIGRYATAPSFGGYLFWMFLIGATNAALNANFIKVLGVWLQPKEIGIGVGCYLTGIGLGQAASVASGSRFATMGSAYLCAVILAVLILILWLFLIKNPPNLKKVEPLPISQTLKFVVGKKDIWVGGLGIFFMLGTYVTVTSFTATFLTSAKGVPAGTAGLCASIIALFMLIGALTSDRLAKLTGSSRLFLFLTGVVSAGGVLLTLTVSYGLMTFIALALTGLASGAFCSYILSLPMLLSYVGPVYAGSAGGLISTLQSAGGFLLPYLFPMLAGNENYSGLLSWVAAGFFLMGVVTLLLPELVKKSR
ncbi:MAG: MFS transporter [Deltaproteobacteria bacterium]|jgi:NNP family nitrate/nitrite transporter-like MFS transporter|nr:MFS transporter [Deltaproteobacteria bacterium]